MSKCYKLVDELDDESNANIWEVAMMAQKTEITHQQLIIFGIMTDLRLNNYIKDYLKRLLSVFHQLSLQFNLH